MLTDYLPGEDRPEKLKPLDKGKAAPGFEKTRQFLCMANVPMLVLVPEATYQEGPEAVQAAIEAKVSVQFKANGFTGATLGLANEVPAKGENN